MAAYRDDLASIHDAGFSDFCLNAAPGLLRALRQSRIAAGLVVDLGCGSGRWAAELCRAGYDVLGVDQSPAFIRLAGQNAPRARFEGASFYRVKLPACDALTSIGECLSYCFDRAAGKSGLRRLFVRVHRALRPGGVFIFDVATPQRIPSSGRERRWYAGADWAILVEASGDRAANLLNRRLTCFRRLGRLYRRSEETHRLRLYEPDEIAAMLRSTGFRVKGLRAYGGLSLPRGIAGFMATKPHQGA